MAKAKAKGTTKVGEEYLRGQWHKVTLDVTINDESWAEYLF